MPLTYNQEPDYDLAKQNSNYVIAYAVGGCLLPFITPWRKIQMLFKQIEVLNIRFNLPKSLPKKFSCTHPLHKFIFRKPKNWINTEVIKELISLLFSCIGCLISVAFQEHDILGIIHIDTHYFFSGHYINVVVTCGFEIPQWYHLK